MGGRFFWGADFFGSRARSFTHTKSDQVSAKISRGNSSILPPKVSGAGKVEEKKEAILEESGPLSERNAY